MKQDQSDGLDLLRGLAAALVALGHARAFVWADYSQGSSGAPLEVAIYGLSSFGHDAVLAFFALSGFLVGGPAATQIVAGTWSLDTYLLSRLVRLWVVLVPALMLTAVLGFFGKMLAGAAGYEGAWHVLIHSGPTSESPASLSALTAAANVLFLQTIFVPVYGANGPLWSLSNEWWYYFGFPTAFATIIYKRNALRLRVLCLVLAVSAFFIMPPEMLYLGIIWCVAAGLGYFFPRGYRWKKSSIFVSAVSAAVAIFAAGVLLWSSQIIGRDVAIGVCLAGLIPLVVRIALPQPIRRISQALASGSFTLYAIHFPVQAFVYFTFYAPERLAPGNGGWARLGILMATTVLATVFTWWLCERRTGEIRIRVLEAWGKRVGRLSRSKKPSAV